MKAIKFHIDAILISFKELLKGKYLLFLIPGAILSLIYYYIQQLSAQTASNALLESDMGWLDYVYSWVNSGTSAVFSFVDFILAQIYIFFVLTILSPFYTILSEKLDGNLTGQTFKTSLVRLLNDFFRMIFVVTLIVLTEITVLIVYWTFSFIIDIEALHTVMYFVISAFFFGFSFYDYSLERYEKGIFDTFTYAFSNPLKVTLTGAIFLLIYEIPFIGTPLSPILAVMIATIVYLYDTNKLSNSAASKTTD